MKPSAPTFRDSSADRIWNDYLAQVERLARRLAAPQRRDMMMEIRAHLLESMLGSDGAESRRLQNAIERLGKPEDYVPVWVEERLAQAADPSLMVRSRWQLLRLDAARGLSGLAGSIALGFGYMLVFYSFVMFVTKLIFPDNVGLFLLPNGVPFVGYADSASASEMLGWWFLPISLGFGIGMFWLLSRLTIQLRR